MISCQRDPMLYLHEDGKDATMDLPNIDVELQAIWNYQLEYDVTYDWKAEWKYKWDATDVELFGKLGYTEPDAFEIRRYYTGFTPTVHTTLPTSIPSQAETSRPTTTMATGTSWHGTTSTHPTAYRAFASTNPPPTTR